MSKQAHTGWLRRIVYAASQRTAPPCHGPLRARAAASIQRGAAKLRVRRVKEQRHSDGGDPPTASPLLRTLRITTAHAPASTEKRIAEAKSRYVYLCLCPRGDAMGEGERGRWYVCYEPNPGTKVGGVSFFLNRQQGKNTSTSGRSLSLSPEANAPTNTYTAMRSSTPCA